MGGGLIATLAETGAFGYGGDEGPASQAVLQRPALIATDATGNVHFADQNNGRVRKIDAHGIVCAAPIVEDIPIGGALQTIDFRLRAKLLPAALVAASSVATLTINRDWRDFGPGSPPWKQQQPFCCGSFGMKLAASGKSPGWPTNSPDGSALAKLGSRQRTWKANCSSKRI